MSARPEGRYQDHYQVLGVEPKASSEVIHRAYSELAAKYHPNNKDTADKDKFKAVTDAYEVLADPAARAAFDGLRSGPEQDSVPKFSGPVFFDAVTREVLRRQSVLCLLYDRRRVKPSRPGLSLRQVESMLQGTADEIHLSVWYLKQKGYVVSDDKSNMQITVQGMEYLEGNLPVAEAILPLLKAAGTSQPSVAAAPVEAAPAAPEPAAAAPAAAALAAPAPKPEPAVTVSTPNGSTAAPTLPLPDRSAPRQIVIPPKR